MEILGIMGLMILGLVVGIVISLIGVSGSVFVIPSLIFFYSIPIHSAIGTSLLVDMIGAMIVGLSFFRQKQVDLNTSLFLILSALIGSQLGVLIAINTGENSLSNFVSLLFIAIGLLLLFRSLKRSKNTESANKKSFYQFKSDWLKNLLISLIGFFIGLLSGIFGAGGGMMIIFVLLVIFQYPPHKAIGTATVIMSIIALSGTIGYLAQGQIIIDYGSIIGLGALLGGIFGSNFAHKLDENNLIIIMGVIFLIVGSMSLILVSSMT